MVLALKSHHPAHESRLTEWKIRVEFATRVKVHLLVVAC